MSLTRFVFGTDNHGVLVNQDDASAFFKFCDEFKPTLRIHGGDNWDLAGLRRGADPKEEGDDIEPDWKAGMDFLKQFRPHVFLLGNHDWRLWKASRDWRGATRSWATGKINEIETEARKLKCRVLPYHSREGVFRCGNLSFVHGYHAGIGAIAQHARVYRSVVLGHLHSCGQVSERGIDRPTAYCVGGLGDHAKMEYAAQRTATLAWGPGWAYGVVNEKTGSYQCWIAQKLDRRWLAPTGICEI